GTFSTIATVGANVTSYSSTGLTPGTLYRHRVRAYNEAGNSAFSNTASATTLTEGLAAPTGLSPSAGQVISTSAVTLSCGAVAGATQYKFRIEYKSGGSWVYYYTYTSATNSKTFYPTVHGTNYRFKVRAKDASSTGPWSAWAKFYFN
ncbi:MAG: fibronectin type III domain-containing protein, partial [Planctomycetota bacterium]